jgi:hypothetical protein
MKLLLLAAASLAALAVNSLNPAYGEEAPAPATLTIARAAGPIQVDGSLGDEGWKNVPAVETWYEINPGDNTPPKVKSTAWLVYDDKFFYAAFAFEDPRPSEIKAPLGDHDNTPSSTDYAGVILDTRNDGRTAMMFLANPRGVEYDAITDDGGSGEDSSPDFFWDAAGKITDKGWNLEMRIPFSSLRYAKADPQTWGIMLYRNYPREFRYQFFSTRLPRGGNCFICFSSKLSGLQGLPSGGHLVLAPYLSGNRTDMPGGDLGTPLERGPLHGDVGLDLKWTPFASAALDATLNPDFSQIESDVAQIGANERFALFFPEKRPFFLEGIELFSTPIQAVYTRTITAPRYGVRGTGKFGKTAFTALFGEDKGGGSVILPGANDSAFADQEFHSTVALGRLRRDFGKSFVSLLASDREQKGGGYFNRLLGPDFQWRPNDGDVVTGQYLMSWSRTPKRPDLSDQWDGRALSGHALDASWNHSKTHVDWYAEVKALDDGFRADNGFVPQVGYRSEYAESGYTFRPQGFVRRLRTYLIQNASQDQEHDLLSRELSPGFGLDARWNSFVRLRWSFDRVRAGDGKDTLPRSRLVYTVQSAPSRFFSQISLDGSFGGQIDFANARQGSGLDATLSATLRPSNHLELRVNEGRRFLNVDLPDGTKPRLFTAKVDRLRATYTFTSRLFLRAIGQYVQTKRDAALYRDAVERESAFFTGSLLFAYKLNWQTVLFAGYGDNREQLPESETLARSDRQFFVKLSYAFQH